MEEKYTAKIKDILKKSDLSFVTTKSVRRILEQEEGVSLSPIKKEINSLIEALFMDFQDAEPAVAQTQAQTQAQRDALVVKQPTTKKTKKEPASKVTKNTKKAKLEPTEKKKRVVNQKVFKVIPPLSNIIGTELCSRFRSVKKIWEYIRKHNLQVPTDKRKLTCDANLKALTGLDEVSAFSLNKYTQKCFIPIPDEEQEHYKQIFKEREDALEPPEEPSS